MLPHAALVEDDVSLRVDAGCQKRRGDLARRPDQLGRFLPHGDRVEVDHAIDAVVARLELDEAADRAEIVAEVKVAGWLDAGKDKRLEGGHEYPRGLWRAVSRAAKFERLMDEPQIRVKRDEFQSSCSR